MLKLIAQIFIVFMVLVISGCSNKISFFNKTKPVSINNYWAVLSQGTEIYTSAFPLYSNIITKGRDLHYLMVVYDTKNKNYTISVVGGKNYAALSEVIIKVNYNEYYLPVAADRAWLTNEKQVSNFIKDMLASDTLIVINTFSDNTQSIDTYSLNGFSDSFSIINRKQ